MQATAIATETLRTMTNLDPETVGADAPVVLELKGIGRTYGPVVALDNVNCKIRLGRVLGLVGENGAGKSTMLNIVCGTDTQTSGTIVLNGQEVAFDSYYEAAQHGIFRVFQELALIPNLSVWENIFLGHEHLLVKAGLIQRSDAIKRTQDLFERFDHGWINVTKPLGDLPFAMQQTVEILRAFALAELLGKENPIILLDEPTAGLTSDEIDFLRNLIDRVRSRSAIVLVSHRLTEVLEWSDDILILKDGVVVGETSADALSEEELHFKMVGRVREKSFYFEDVQREPEQETMLKLDGLSDGQSFKDVSLEVRRGEILGIAGVLGSGKTELGRAIFGVHKATGGTIEYRGQSVPTDHLSVDWATHVAIGYVPPDRKVEGIIDTFSVMQNISIARIVTQKSGILDPRFEAKEARDHVQRQGIKTRAISSSILSLSGGNQQKTILARWLASNVQLLILDNPTRGIDAGAKAQIYELLRELTDKGLTILLISDDLLEVIGLSNRIVVMKDKVITSSFDAPAGGKPSEAELVAMMV